MAPSGGSLRSLVLVLSMVAVVIAGALIGLSQCRRGAAPARSAEVGPEEEEAQAAPPEDSAAAPSVRTHMSGLDIPGRETTAARRILALSGLVLDAKSRAPVQGAEVQAAAGGKPFQEGGPARAKATSDVGGRYALEFWIPASLAWDPKVWAVSVDARGDRFHGVHRQLRPASFEEDPAHPGTFRARCDLEVTLLLAVRGRIVGLADGTPIEGAASALLSRTDGEAVPRCLAVAKTDAAGRFLIQLEEDLPGRLVVLGSAAGFLAKSVPGFLDRARVVDIGDIALSQGACLEGIVVTADGSRPVANEVVAQSRTSGDVFLYVPGSPARFALREDRFIPLSARSAIGADGRFRLCGLVDEDYQLSLSYPGCVAGGRLEFLEVRAPSTGIRIQVSRAVYRLRALDAESSTDLARAEIVLVSPKELTCPIAESFVLAMDPGVESTVRVVAEGYRALPCTLPALAAGEVRDLEFRLVRLPPQVACTLVVTSPFGAPVSEIELRIRSDDPELNEQGRTASRAMSAENGRFALPRLLPGDYHIDVEPNYHFVNEAATWLCKSLDLRVREGLEPVAVQLEEGGLVQATVAKAGGAAVDARTELLRTPASAPEQLDWRDDAGTFGGWIPKSRSLRLAKPLPAGRWTIRFGSDDCKAKDVVVDIEVGSTRTIDVVLEPIEPR